VSTLHQTRWTPAQLKTRTHSIETYPLLVEGYSDRKNGVSKVPDPASAEKIDKRILIKIIDGFSNFLTASEKGYEK